MTINADQTKTTDPPTLTITITSTSSGLPIQIYLFNQTTGIFERVANVAEIINFPTTPTAGVAFYRAETFTANYNTLEEVDTDLEKILNDMDQLDVDFVDFETDGDWNTTVPIVVDGNS